MRRLLSRTQKLADRMEPHLKLFAPGPSFPTGFFLKFFKRRLEFLEELAQSNCPVAFFKFAGERVYLVNDPELIKDVLVLNHRRFKKGRGLERAKILLGEGLLTSEGEAHRRQRRIVQPVFQHKYLQNYADIMVDRTMKLCSGWKDGMLVNMSEQIISLTLMIVGECLFGTDVESDTRRIGSLVNKVMESFFYFVSPLGPLYRLLGHPKVQDAFAARRSLNDIVLRMIDARRSGPPRQNDLLSLLFSAQDSETGCGMSDAQLRDEAMTLFLAGHETTANGLSWTLFLLATHKGVGLKLRAEIESVIGRDRPGVGHLEQLKFLDQVIRESLRLYPPAYVIGRRAVEDHRLAGIRIPKGAVLLVSPWTMQRSKRYYETPLDFRPERWTAEFRACLPRFAFFPFGGGPRQCIGEGFAWMEMALVLAVLVRDWDFELLLGQQIRPNPAMTLRSDRPIRMRLKKVLEAYG
ncbi:MAG: cytochrome P450 [Verrucomicrobia bacterium]|nr:cytochrome P450 [Verrucomicrobiota bacterium]